MKMIKKMKWLAYESWRTLAQIACDFFVCAYESKFLRYSEFHADAIMQTDPE